MRAASELQQPLSTSCAENGMSGSSSDGFDIVSYMDALQREGGPGHHATVPETAQRAFEGEADPMVETQGFTHPYYAGYDEAAGKAESTVLDDVLDLIDGYANEWEPMDFGVGLNAGVNQDANQSYMLL